ncbi:MAG: beta-galactosidase trimerization domain-containing protein [Victivallales bacterium]|nr:beta-galactosidase trimerization domain-containing protein [Victivallales bacterium]
MFETHLPFRQVHLDFHTSEHCPDIGLDFSEEQFAEALKLGRVQSINFFAQCHHGWAYYPNPTVGNSHPNLKTDLVGRMLKVCKENGINAEVYISVGYNERAARLHPEWCNRKPDGNFQMYNQPAHPDTAAPISCWKHLCLNTPYLDEVLATTRDIMERYNPPGIWYDITRQPPCTCAKCTADMIALGLDPNNPVDLNNFAERVYIKYLNATYELIRSYNKETTIYHNGSSQKARYDIYPYISHVEIESLPTGGWGYDHFPPNARYFTTQPTQVVGMTGKFHKSWGEFGGFKNPTALRYECAQIVSLGCLACTGDQLHPCGKMDMETYRTIGEAYEYIETREPWLADAKPKANVAVLGTMEMYLNHQDEAITGACKVLMEAHIPHVCIDETMDFSPYDLLILPDYGRLDPGVRDKLNRYIARGGKLLMTYQSGTCIDSWDFALDLGCKSSGPSENDVEYFEVTDLTAANMVTSPILLYKSGIKFLADDSATVLAHRRAPMFNRTWGHFCSHQNTPYRNERMEEPEAVRKGSIIYIASPLFSMYNSEGMRLHRDFIINCINLLQPKKMIECNLPSCGRVAITSQEKENRDIIHLMYATPTKRGNVEVIEDIVKLNNVAVSYRVEKQPRAVRLVPEGTELPFTYSDGCISFTLPVLEMAQLIAMEY